MTPTGCTCPADDWWRCIQGRVYGPCSSDDCGGVCSYEGQCSCTNCHGAEHAEEWRP